MADPTHTIDHHRSKRPLNMLSDDLNSSPENVMQKAKTFNSEPVISDI